MKDASFIDIIGAAVTVPADQLSLYATIKSEQLDVLAGIIADKTAGFQVELTEQVMYQLTALANELAHTTRHLVLALTEEALEGKAGAA